MSDTVLKQDINNPTSNATTQKIVVRKIKKPQQTLVYRCAKRALDIILSLIASVLLLIPMLIIGVLIKFDSKGPILYKQERLGEDGKPFMLYKFRSMRIDAEADGAKWADEIDERCTKVGAVLRKFRLDELPQIPFNILVGNLSFVGPRPERKCFYDEFAKYIDGFEQRLYVKQGLTGLAQISGGYDLKPEEKIIYDLEYIEKCSILSDLKIMLKTVLVVFNHEGAR